MPQKNRECKTHMTILKKGNHLMATKAEYRDLPTFMRQLHEYYIVDTKEGVGDFDVIAPRIHF